MLVGLYAFLTISSPGNAKLWFGVLHSKSVLLLSLVVLSDTEVLLSSLVVHHWQYCISSFISLLQRKSTFVWIITYVRCMLLRVKPIVSRQGVCRAPLVSRQGVCRAPLVLGGVV